MVFELGVGYFLALAACALRGPLGAAQFVQREIALVNILSAEPTQRELFMFPTFLVIFKVQRKKITVRHIATTGADVHFGAALGMGNNRIFVHRVSASKTCRKVFARQHDRTVIDDDLDQLTRHHVEGRKEPRKQNNWRNERDLLPVVQSERENLVAKAAPLHFFLFIDGDRRHMCWSDAAVRGSDMLDRTPVDIQTNEWASACETPLLSLAFGSTVPWQLFVLFLVLKDLPVPAGRATDRPAPITVDQKTAEVPFEI